MIQQVRALFMKRVLYMYREWKINLVWVSNILYPPYAVFLK
jgi:hypothetical protein